MESYTAFRVDPHTGWVERHNREVQEVWNTFRADKPIRVPVEYTGGRAFYQEENHLDWAGYYEDPDEMIRIQLESAKCRMELPFGDHALGEWPESWGVFVDFHPVEGAPASDAGSNSAPTPCRRMSAFICPWPSAVICPCPACSPADCSQGTGPLWSTSTGAAPPDCASWAGP